MPEDFKEAVIARAKELSLAPNALAKSVIDELKALAAREIAERILAGEVSPPPPRKARTKGARLRPRR